MSSAPVLDFRTVDLQNLTVPPLQKKDHGLSCKPLYRAPDSNTPAELSIQTPICRFPFGLSDNTSQASYSAGNPIRYNVSASFDNYKENPIQKDFFNFATQIQEYAVHLAAHNSKEWFGEECDATAAKFLFNKWIKMPKGDNAEKYDPTFRLSTRAKKDKEGKETGEFWTSCYDVDGTPINLSKLENGAKGHMKIKLTSFYVIAGKFGWTWDVEWIRLTSRAQPKADDYNANMYGEAPALPSMSYQDGGLPPSATIYEDSAPPTENVKREANESVAALETRETGTSTGSTTGGKRVKRAN
jgi:hypothetical protein